jgi:hypothetical protein
MKKSLSQRLFALSAALVVTWALLGGVTALFLGEDAATPALAQRASPAPRA